MKRTAAFGSWRSPITSELVARSYSPKTYQLSLCSPPGTTKSYAFWLQRQPSEGGHDALMVRELSAESSANRVTPKGFSVRSRVHEYGGPPFIVSKDGSTVFFSDFATNGLFRQKIDLSKKLFSEPPARVTHDEKLRFADFVLCEPAGKLISVVEDHRKEGEEAKNYVASIDGQTGEMEVLFEGTDFVSCPRLSPASNLLSFISWNHPAMPWDNTTLHLIQLDPKSCKVEAERVLFDEEASTMCPTWTFTGDLLFVSDVSDWWSIYKLPAQDIASMLNDTNLEKSPEVVYSQPEMEFGAPTWGISFQCIAPLPDGSVAARGCSTNDAAMKLCIIKDGKLQELEQPCFYLDQLSNVTSHGIFAITGSSPALPTQILVAKPGTDSKIAVSTMPLAPHTEQPKIPETMISIPETIQFPTDDGIAYGHLYLPTNGEYEGKTTDLVSCSSPQVMAEKIINFVLGPANELPPLLVQVHGGPTAANFTKYDPAIQYWTSRGFAILDVNYGGSTGYGRKFKNRLRKKWGVVDVSDCCNGALHLAKRKIVDRKKLLIHGGSAGGFTALACLAFKPGGVLASVNSFEVRNEFVDVFAAAASFYGVTDLGKLAEDTHKFESRYLDGLIGPYPQDKATYDARSPINAVDRISAPVILFQGSEDKVVPLNQAELMHNTCRKNGLKSCLVVYEGEGHGFRRMENIISTKEAELYFYGTILGFEVDVQPEIKQLVDNDKAVES